MPFGLRIAATLAATAMTLQVAPSPAHGAAPPPRTHHAPAPAPAPQPRPAPSPTPAVDPLDAHASADNWHQILMAPRVTGNLRAVTLDPSDPKSIYVGTEEGTLVHSIDGGVTWEEIELAPFLLESPTVPVILSGDGYKAIDVFAGVNVAVGQVYYGYPHVNRRKPGTGPHTVALPIFDLPPYFINPIRIGWTPELILRDIGTKDPAPYEEVRRIRICPGGTNSVLVATRTNTFTTTYFGVSSASQTAPMKLLASSDGASFVPVFITRPSDKIGDVACSPANPDEIILTTGDATLRSVDGGFSFDPVPGALGGTGSQAATWGPGEGGKPTLYLGSGRDLWVGDPSLPDGMKTIDVGGEFTEIRHIAATAHSIWLATDTGVRSSKDGGATWTSVDDLEGFDWDMVAVAPGPGGVEHVAVLRKDIAMDSVDGGVIFRPFFKAQSRRTLRHLVPLPQPTSSGFLLLSSGEIWSTAVTLEAPSTDAREEESRRMALRRLRHMPSLGETLDRARAKTDLLEAQIDEKYESLKASAWMPVVRFGFQAGQRNIANAQAATISKPTGTFIVDSENFYHGEVDLIWNLGETVLPDYHFVPARKDIHQIRNRYLFAVEDAYQERRQILAQLATGGLDAEQQLTLEARLEVLDVILHELADEKR